MSNFRTHAVHFLRGACVATLNGRLRFSELYVVIFVVHEKIEVGQDNSIVGSLH